MQILMIVDNMVVIASSEKKLSQNVKLLSSDICI